MALINCPECGQQVSDKAFKCPNCGFPIDKVHKPNRVTSQRPKYILTVALFVLCFVGIGILLISKHDKNTPGVHCEEEEIVTITPEFISSIHKYDEIKSFSDGMAAVRKNGLWGYVNTKGEEVIPCQYDVRVGKFSDGLACVPKKGSDFDVYFINKEGSIVINGYGMPSGLLASRYGTIFNGMDLPHFINGLCEVTINQKNNRILEDYIACTIDTKGEIVSDSIIVAEDVPNNCFSLKIFSEGENADCKYGYKNGEGKVIIPAKYDYAWEFSNGVGLVAIECQNPTDLYGRGVIIYGFVDEQGNDTFTDDDYARLEEYKIYVDAIIEQSEWQAKQQRMERERESHNHKETPPTSNPVQNTVLEIARD